MFFAQNQPSTNLDLVGSTWFYLYMSDLDGESDHFKYIDPGCAAVIRISDSNNKTISLITGIAEGEPLDYEIYDEILAVRLTYSGSKDVNIKVEFFQVRSDAVLATTTVRYSTDYFNPFDEYRDYENFEAVRMDPTEYSITLSQEDLDEIFQS